MLYESGSQSGYYQRSAGYLFDSDFQQPLSMIASWTPSVLVYGKACRSSPSLERPKADSLVYLYDDELLNGFYFYEDELLTASISISYKAAILSMPSSEESFQPTLPLI